MINATPRPLYPRERNPVPSAKGTGFASRPVRTVAKSLAPAGIWSRGVQPVPITYLLTPWSKVLLDNLTGLQLVKKFLAFYGIRRFITTFTNAHHLSSHQSISPGPREVHTFRNKSSFYGEELSTPRPTPKLEDHPLSAVCDCLFNIFAATLQIGGRSSIRNLQTRHAVVTGTHFSRRTHNMHFKSRRGDAVWSVVKSQNTAVKLRASITVSKHVGGTICTIWIGESLWYTILGKGQINIFKATEQIVLNVFKVYWKL
jgi:hypothetical protein